MDIETIFQDPSSKFLTPGLFPLFKINHSKRKFFCNFFIIKCPECGKGKIAIVFREYTYRKPTSFVRCSNNCGYDGGTYPSTIEDIKYVEKCPSCRGILVRQGNMLRCCLNYHYGCMETKKLKLDKEDLDDEI